MRTLLLTFALGLLALPVAQAQTTGSDIIDQTIAAYEEMMRGAPEDEDEEELDQTLDQMPAAQREMMEQMMHDQMMHDQMAEFDQMMAGDAMIMETHVTDLQINAGRPE